MITKEQVKKIAELSHLDLNEKEIKQYSEELSRVIDFIEVLKKVNIDGVEPLLCTSELEDVMREDRARPSTISEDILVCAPESQKNYVKTKSFSNL